MPLKRQAAVSGITIILNRLPPMFTLNTLEAKIEGMACYRTESREYPHPRSTEALRSLGRLRGVSTGFEMAEAFVLLREVFGDS